jgi:hypothetical protein
MLPCTDQDDKADPSVGSGIAYPGRRVDTDLNPVRREFRNFVPRHGTGRLVNGVVPYPQLYSFLETGDGAGSERTRTILSSAMDDVQRRWRLGIDGHPRRRIQRLRRRKINRTSMND